MVKPEEGRMAIEGDIHRDEITGRQHQGLRRCKWVFEFEKGENKASSSRSRGNRDKRWCRVVQGI